MGVCAVRYVDDEWFGDNKGEKWRAVREDCPCVVRSSTRALASLIHPHPTPSHTHTKFACTYTRAHTHARKLMNTQAPTCTRAPTRSSTHAPTHTYAVPTCPSTPTPTRTLAPTCPSTPTPAYARLLAHPYTHPPARTCPLTHPHTHSPVHARPLTHPHPHQPAHAQRSAEFAKQTLTAEQERNHELELEHNRMLRKQEVLQEELQIALNNYVPKALIDAGGGPVLSCALPVQGRV